MSSSNSKEDSSEEETIISTTTTSTIANTTSSTSNAFASRSTDRTMATSSSPTERQTPAPPPTRGHQRSISHGGQQLLIKAPTAKFQPQYQQYSEQQESVNGANAENLPLQQPFFKKSALKGHRRVFSHGQIQFTNERMSSSSALNEANQDFEPRKGHKRTGSKTEFILPPGHEERERERQRSGLNRSGSYRVGSGSAGVGRSGSASHRRQPSRTDSLAFSFRGHSRQASRTDSIYTLRQTNTNYKRKIFNFGKKKQVDVETKHRTIVPNHIVPSDAPESEHPNHIYLDNHVRTTKYTFLSFLPKNLFEQFHRFANLYFLLIVLLNWLPAINAFGKEISMLPLMFVLGVTAIKDLFEDRRRHISDKRVNNSSCRIYEASSDRYVKCLWKDIKVGDIVHLSCNEMIPADILLLRTSDPLGLCYIDTRNLDGEANLKQREVPRGYDENQSTFKPQNFRSTLECDMPTTKIYRFHGSIIHPWGERVPVGKDNLLLRECVLKNTDFVEGLVVYAGHESKAMLNNGGPRYKRSKLERQMNLEVLWCVVILIVLCFVGALGYGMWLSTFEEYVPFLNTLNFEATNPAMEGFLTFWTFVIILQVIIPLSLYVTIEMTKLLQIYFIHEDVDMYDEEYDKRVECRALNIPEELGQIQYMFCDKTGTLTENNMVFKRCTIGGVDFDHNSVSTKAFGGQRKTIIPANPRLSRCLSHSDSDVSKDTYNKPEIDPKLAQDFFLLLAACNTVIVAKYPHRDMMNASGLICQNSPAVLNIEESKTESKDVMISATSGDEKRNVQILEQVPEETNISQSPPNSIMSTTSSTAPLRPDPNLTPQRPQPGLERPSKLKEFLSARPMLSPIAASPESTPTIEETPMTKSRSLQLPNLLNPLSKLVSYNSISSISKHLSSRASTPTASQTPEPCKPIYEAESPDELALVDAAFAYNCHLLKRTPFQISVSTPHDGIVDYQVLHTLPFDSVRKRMSVILMHPITREKILFCKGADSSMFPRIDPPNDSNGIEILEKTQSHLKSYATLGLRVLVMAKRILSESEYKSWAQDHHEAENSLQKRDRLLFESYSRIECHMELVGTTAIEDKLQEGVPETIRNLRAAGIVVWVLTGDKQETAINIAYSCKLFSKDMKIITLNAKNRDGAESTINYYLEDIRSEKIESTSDLREDESSDILKKRALVVDGKTLIYILDKRANLQEPFLTLASYCSSVLCCRATPLQKAYIVRIVKEELKMHTLAIGDGANDVSMIQTADVGVGISGQEGMQAVMASDFAISKFKYIERLLLVHGHWNYDRLARMVLYFFYKNAAFVFVCFWYQLYCGFSGAVMIDQMYLMLYNLLFTSLPPMAIGVFDQDIPDVVLTSLPHLYKQGRLSEVYKPYSFWINMADSLYQSLVIFFTCYGAYSESNIGIWEFGTVMCTQCLCAMLFHLAIEIKAWTILHWTSVLLSILFYFAFALVYNGICVNCFGLNVPFWVMQYSMSTLYFWVITLFSSVLAVFPRIIVKTFQNMFSPTDVAKVIMARNRAAAKLRDVSSNFGPNGRFSNGATSVSSMSRNGIEKYSSEMEMIPPA